MTWLLGLLSPRVLAGLGLAIAIAAGLWYVDHRAANRQALIDSAVLKGKEADWATERAKAAEAAASASEAYRAREQAWAASAAQIQTEGEARHAQITADADRANRAAGSLRGALDIATRAIRSGAAQGAPAASDCAPAIRAADMLAELFKRADERAGQLAGYADNASAAGAACERAYDSLAR